MADVIANLQQMMKNEVVSRRHRKSSSIETVGWNCPKCGAPVKNSEPYSVVIMVVVAALGCMGRATPYFSKMITELLKNRKTKTVKGFDLKRKEFLPHSV